MKYLNSNFKESLSGSSRVALRVNDLFPLQHHSCILLWKLWLFSSFPNYSVNLIQQHDKHISLLYKNIQSQNFNVYLNMLGTKPGLDFLIFTF